jgi:hypothetical protein
VIYEEDQNFPGVTTEFRSPWFGGDVGNNNFMPSHTGRIIATNDYWHDLCHPRAPAELRAATNSGGSLW